MLIEHSQRTMVIDDVDTLVLTPRGEIDLSTVGEFKTALQRGRARSQRHLVAELRYITFIDSTGIHALLDEQTRAASTNQSFAIIDDPGPVHRLLSLLGLEEHFQRVDLQEETRR